MIGYLPHSIRLSLRDHSFDLAASCEAEKSVWASALVAAREDSTVPPFELPASVSPFAARSRRMSSVGSLLDMAPLSPAPLSPPNKRHTLGAIPLATPAETGLEDTPFDFGLPPSTSTINSGIFSTIVLRRASPNQRLTVDRGLVDIFSESCAQARSKAQLHHALFLSDTPIRTSSEIRDRLTMRESTMLRRKSSFLDSTRQHRRSNSNSDIAFSGEVKGSIIPVRPSRSFAGSSRTPLIVGDTPRIRIRARRTGTSVSVGGITTGTESATELEGGDGEGDSTSDFGTLRAGGGSAGGRTTRGNSLSSNQGSSGLTPLKSTLLGSFRPGLEPINSAIAVPQSSYPNHDHDYDHDSSIIPISPLASTTFISSSSSNSPARFASLRRRGLKKSTSVINLYQRSEVERGKTMSTPSSPILRASRMDGDGDIRRSTSGKDRPIPPTQTRHLSIGPTGYGSGSTKGRRNWGASFMLDDKDLPPLPLPPKDRPISIPIRTDSYHNTESSGNDYGQESIKGNTEDSIPVIEAEVTRSGSKSSSHHTRNSTTSSTSTDNNTTPDVPVYALGNGGLTNSPSTGAWGTLKRTLTSRSLRNSVINFEEYQSSGELGVINSSNSIPNSSPAAARYRTQSARPTPSSPSMSRSSSFGYERESSGGEEVLVGGTIAREGDEGAVMLAPRRRRSVRLLQGLRSLTAM